MTASPTLQAVLCKDVQNGADQTFQLIMASSQKLGMSKRLKLGCAYVFSMADHGHQGPQYAQLS